MTRLSKQAIVLFAGIFCAFFFQPGFLKAQRLPHDIQFEKISIPGTIRSHKRNLVSNALKFTAEGNPVKITGTRKEGYAEINVVDCGIGKSQEYVKKVLSMDQPLLKKGTSNEKGTGLGLLLCKKFVEMNKGELRISSVEHVGTTFTVILPLTVHHQAIVEKQN